MTDKPTYQCGKPERGVVYAWEGEVEELRTEIERLRKIENAAHQLLATVDRTSNHIEWFEPLGVLAKVTDWKNRK